MKQDEQNQKVAKFYPRDEAGHLLITLGRSNIKFYLPCIYVLPCTKWAKNLDASWKAFCLRGQKIGH